MFSYDPAQSTTKDLVRFRIGDTDSSVAEGQRLEDEEIEATVANQPSFSEAMAQCAEALAAKFFRSATTKKLASASVSYEKRADYLLDMAQRLRNGIESFGAADIVITGTTKTELAESAADTDLIQARAQAGQFDNPDASDPSAEDEE